MLRVRVYIRVFGFGNARFRPHCVYFQGVTNPKKPVTLDKLERALGISEPVRVRCIYLYVYAGAKRCVLIFVI